MSSSSFAGTSTGSWSHPVLAIPGLLPEFTRRDAAVRYKLLDPGVSWTALRAGPVGAGFGSGTYVGAKFEGHVDWNVCRKSPDIVKKGSDTFQRWCLWCRKDACSSRPWHWWRNRSSVPRAVGVCISCGRPAVSFRPLWIASRAPSRTTGQVGHMCCRLEAWMIDGVAYCSTPCRVAPL